MSTQRNILNLFVRAVLCDNIFGGPTECLTRPEVLTEVDGSIDNFYYVIVSITTTAKMKVSKSENL
jgi:hypothetical protein